MKKILLAEDDPLLIDIYTTKFKEAGFETIVVSDGEKAVPAIEKENPDLVVLDIVLPNVEGWEILRALQGNQKFKRQRIIILSNLGQKEEVAKGMDLGAERYLIKAHYTPSQVVEEIRKILR